jgi:hypothetical protein
LRRPCVGDGRVCVCVCVCVCCVASGTLRDYRRKHRGIDATHAVRRWGKDILLGLQYLHAQVRRTRIRFALQLRTAGVRSLVHRVT